MNRLRLSTCLQSVRSRRKDVIFNCPRRKLADMPHVPMDARTPMIFVKKDMSIESMESPWVEEKDPGGSSLTYWWNKNTNETTVVGASKPGHWVEVRDPAGSSLTYWWDKDSNTTTALGRPRPHFTESSTSIQQQQHGQIAGTPPVTSFGGAMVQMAAVGFGMSLAMIGVRAVIG